MGVMAPRPVTTTLFKMCIRDSFKIEGGAFVKARAELPVMENVNLITTADFFTPYSKDFGNIDVNWGLRDFSQIEWL